MNIFVLDFDNRKSAESYVDSHVVKMPLETAQMLCTCLWNYNITAPYKATHKKHPCNLWLYESIDNYNWLCDLGIQICKEYTHRYNKRHKCEDIINWCIQNPPPIGSFGVTKQPMAMPNECKVNGDVISSYRKYYLEHKQHLFKWTKRQAPSWINNHKI